MTAEGQRREREAEVKERWRTKTTLTLRRTRYNQACISPTVTAPLLRFTRIAVVDARKIIAELRHADELCTCVSHFIGVLAPACGIAPFNIPRRLWIARLRSTTITKLRLVLCMTAAALAAKLRVFHFVMGRTFEGEISQVKLV